MRPITEHPAFFPAVILATLVSVMTPTLAGPAAGDWWRGRPLQAALEELRSRGLNIVYSDSLVTAGMRVIEGPTATAPREILDQILEPHSLEARPGPGDVLLIVARSGERRLVRGTVIARGRARPIAGAQIRVGETIQLADLYGRYELALPNGVDRIEVSAPGFISRRFKNLQVEPGTVVELTLALDPLAIVHESVAVSAAGSAIDAGVASEPVSLLREDLGIAPQLTDDPYEAIARLPGAASSDTSGKINVRGGRSDELLLVLDGLEIADPFHVQEFQGGLFSVIDSTTVGDLSYYGGAFPVEFGNRLSGVIDVSTRDVEGDVRTAVTASTSQLRIASGGGLTDGSGGWFFSLRRVDPTLVVSSWFPELIYDPIYYDLVGKISRRIGPKTTLNANVLLSFDENRSGSNSLGDDGMPAADAEFAATSFGNNYVWLSAETVWNPRMLSRTIVSYGASDRDRSLGSTLGPVLDHRDYSFLGFDQSWTLVASGRHHLKWGYGFRLVEARYDYHSDAVEITSRPSGTELNGFVSDTIRLGSTTLVEIGTRWDRENYSQSRNPVFSPRASLIQTFGRRMTLRAGFGHFHQSQRVYELQVEDGLDQFNPIQAAEQAQLSFERTFSTGWRMRVGGYRTKIEAPGPRFENQFDPLSLVPELEPDRIRVEPERSQTHGIELTAQGEADGNFHWSAGYAFSSAEDTIDGRTVPRAWDQRHAVNLSLGYRLNERWEFGASGTLHTGWPTTAVFAEPVDEPDGSTTIMTTLGPRNATRFSNYRRVDLRGRRIFRPGTQQIAVFIDVANVLDNKNYCCVEGFEFVPGLDGEVKVIRDEREGLGATFSIGATWEF